MIKIIKGKVVIRKVVVDGKTYTYYYIQIPKEIAEKLKLKDGQTVGISIYELEE